MIAIGSATNFDYKADYSQWGSGVLDLLCHSSGGSVAVTTTDLTGTNGGAGDYVDTFGGTSSATPLCAGIAALMLTRSPGLTASQLRIYMEVLARKIGTMEFLDVTTPLYGNGAATAYSSLFYLPAGATIVVETATLADTDSTSFSYTGSITASLSDGEQSAKPVAPEAPTTYPVTQQIPAGWELHDIDCDDIDSTVDLGLSKANFKASPGETVTCVFTNCDTAVELSDLTVSTAKSYESCGTITAEDFVVGSAGDVEFLAPTSISLRSGFVARGSFAATITD